MWKVEIKEKCKSKEKRTAGKNDQRDWSFEVTEYNNGEINNQLAKRR